MESKDRQFHEIPCSIVQEDEGPLALLEEQGTSLGDADLRIAAIALVRSLTVVTANTRYFRRVPGLPVENWLL